MQDSPGWVSRTGAREEVVKLEPQGKFDLSGMGFLELELEEWWSDWIYRATFTSLGWVYRTGARGEVVRLDIKSNRYLSGTGFQNWS